MRVADETTLCHTLPLEDDQVVISQDVDDVAYMGHNVKRMEDQATKYSNTYKLPRN